MNHSLIAALAAAIVALAPLCSASEPGPLTSGWPQWRGPFANGTASPNKPPIRWSETENVKWKVKIPGFGTSTPIIFKDQVFILTARPTGKKVEQAAAAPAPEPAGGGQGGRRGGGRMRAEKPSEIYQFMVMSIDRTTGKTLWEKVAREQVPHEGHHRDHGFASCSPVTDGEHLYAYFGSRGLYCYDLQGNLKWEKDLGDMQTRNAFGEGSSPALHGNTLVINWDHEGDDFVVALDKRDGKELWRQKRDEPTSWATPLVVEHEGKPQVVISATNQVRSYDLATGTQVWECSGMTGNVVPTPVSGFGMVYPISGFRGAALLAIKLGRTGNLTDSDAIAWKHNKSTPYVPSPLLAGDRLYFCAGNTGTLSCLEAKTGKPVFEAERISELLGGVYASPVAADGRIYLLGRDGKAVVLKQGDTVESLAANKLDDRFDASPAIVGDALFLRGHEHLYCIAE